MKKGVNLCENESDKWAENIDEFLEQ